MLVWDWGPRICICVCVRACGVRVSLPASELTVVYIAPILVLTTLFFSPSLFLFKGPSLSLVRAALQRPATIISDDEDPFICLHKFFMIFISLCFWFLVFWAGFCCLCTVIWLQLCHLLRWISLPVFTRMFRFQPLLASQLQLSALVIVLIFNFLTDRLPTSQFVSGLLL